VIRSSFDTLLRLSAPVLATLLVSLNVLVPLLDRAERSAGPVLESEHNPSTCVRAHDHTVCTQHSSNLSSPAGVPRHGGTAHTTSAPIPLIDDVAVVLADRAPRHSRAPPLG
jgi:hypothetical protein